MKNLKDNKQKNLLKNYAKGGQTMCEILFRGFHPCKEGDKTVYVEGKAVKGRWVYGAYCCMGDKQQPIPHIISYSKDDEFGDWVEVLPSTVSQYTGLTDKNGAKIFEGDMVMSPYIDPIFKSTYSNGELKCLNSESLPIVFYRGTFCVDYSSEDKGLIAVNAFEPEKDIEIIGNTHEEGRDEQ